MLGFLGYLIKQGLFTVMVLSFLSAGHTHNDVDQFFSRLSIYLRNHDALHMAELHGAITGPRKATGLWQSSGIAAPTFPNGSTYLSD